jgi:hypothetical protein
MTTIAIKTNTKAPEIGDDGSIGFADLVIDRIYNEDWGASFYSFGWICSGLRHVGLITKEIADFKEFLEENRENNVHTFLPDDEDPEEENVDWDNLIKFSPSHKPEYKECSYQITVTESGRSLKVESTDLLIPNVINLTHDNIQAFLMKLHDAPDIDDAFTSPSPLIDPYDGLDEIRNFISANRDSSLVITIQEI